MRFLPLPAPIALVDSTIDEFENFLKKELHTEHSGAWYNMHHKTGVYPSYVHHTMKGPKCKRQVTIAV